MLYIKNKEGEEERRDEDVVYKKGFTLESKVLY